MKRNKIDFVIIWVDGSDKKWLAKKAKYDLTAKADDRDIRYRDWDILKYWFRGVEKYAPWVNNIYFVTDGQKPEWLNISNPKIKLVDHKDFIPKEYLPTFSSHTIELNLHRIKGLSENFVYFNDDMFIVNKVKPETFFKNGKPVEMANLNPVMPREDIKVTENVRFNNTVLINKHFDVRKVISAHPLKWLNPKYGIFNICTLFHLPYPFFVGYIASHLPAAYLKSTFKEVWNEEYDTLHKTCQHKFRDSSDVNQYLFLMWQLCKGNFCPKRKNIGDHFPVKDIEDAKKVAKAIRTRKYKMVCINDEVLDVEKLDPVIEEIQGAFDSKLKEKSGYEK